MEKLRELKKKRLANGGKSTENLIDSEEENPHARNNDSDEEPEEKQEEAEFTEEDASNLEKIESPIHFYQCPVFQTTMRLSKYLEY